MIALALILATVTGNPPPAVYTCTGSVTVYAIPFPYLAASQVVVTQTTAMGIVATLGQPGGYSVKPSIAPSVGTATLTVPCPSGYTLTISRSVPFTQPQSFRTGSYQGPAHEQAFDREEMQIQQNAATHATDKATQAARDASQDASIAGIGNSVSALNGSSQAVTSASSVLAFGGTTSRTLTSRFGDTLSAKDFGAAGDGSTNDAAAIQALANAIATSKGRGFLPCGTYLINSAISISPTFFGFTLEGAATNCVTIKAGAAMTSVISFTDATANGRFIFRNLTIDGNALAQYGLKSTQFRYGKLEKIVVQGTTVAGAHFMAGWDIVVRDSEFVNNTGDGIVFGDTQGNDVTLDKTLLTSNTGFGARFYGGGPVAVRGGAVQGNAKGGLYFVALGRPAVVDGVYFEANAQTGATFTTPAKTIKADVIANGVGIAQADTNLSAAFPSPNVTVRNSLFNATYTETAIYVTAASAMNIIGNYGAVAVPLLKTWGDSTVSKPQNVTISGNAGFSKDWDVDSITTSRQLAFSTWSSDSVVRINYFPRDVYKMTKVGVSSGTSILKRGATKYQGQETYDVDQGAGDTFGITIDTTVNTELASALIYVSAWAKASATTAGPRLGIGGKSNTGSLAADTAWHHIEFADIAPAAGAVTVGFSKLGATAGDIVSFSRIVVSIVGAPDREFLRDLSPVMWSTTAAPTTGTWAQGDVVWNTAPAAAGVPGWVCTTAGAPGTWKAMAALAP